mmetsp:Transcript_10388/g.15194  ORF Transcript_10388/g.15194 Transcript_10388/m.15194 type:complete len:193 (+) Transcript_10388:73-651(+)
MASSSQFQKLAEKILKDTPTVSCELLILSYGSLVLQLIEDFDDMDEVNKRLYAMGEYMGERMIDEYFVLTKFDTPCENFRGTSEPISKLALRLFLGIQTAQVRSVVTNDKNDAIQYSIIFHDNPLNEFVHLPDKYKNTLWYSNMICGAISGALKKMLFETDVTFLKDYLRGDDSNEIRVKLIKELKPIKEEE